MIEVNDFLLTVGRDILLWGQYEAVIIMIVFALPYVNLLKEGDK